MSNVAFAGSTWLSSAWMLHCMAYDKLLQEGKLEGFFRPFGQEEIPMVLPAELTSIPPFQKHKEIKHV